MIRDITVNKKVRTKLLNKRESNDPNNLLPVSFLLLTEIIIFWINDETVITPIKIITPAKSSDNCLPELSQLLIYAPISSEYLKLEKIAIKSEAI